MTKSELNEKIRDLKVKGFEEGAQVNALKKILVKQEDAYAKTLKEIIKLTQELNKLPERKELLAGHKKKVKIKK